MSHAVKDNRGKWALNYEGPFVVKRAFSGGALMLTNMDGEELPLPVNFDVVKRYYAKNLGQLMMSMHVLSFLCVFLVSLRDSRLLYISHHNLLKEKNMGLRLQSSPWFETMC